MICVIAQWVTVRYGTRVVIAPCSTGTPYLGTVERPTSPMCDVYTRYIGILVRPKFNRGSLLFDSQRPSPYLHPEQFQRVRCQSRRALDYLFYQQGIGPPLFPNLLAEFNYLHFSVPLLPVLDRATFTKRAAIAYRQVRAFLIRSWCHAITFVFTNFVQS